jgi:hypothetical protein
VSAGFWVKRLEDVPLVPTDDPEDFDWYPLQHHFEIGAFGVNAFGGDEGISLVAEHDERKAEHQELYLVVKGAARFTIEGQAVDVPALSIVAVPDPAVTRAAVSTEDGTIVVAIGAPADSGFETTWRAKHFEQVPRAHGGLDET